MAEIEKKLSDYQVSECDTVEGLQVEPFDPKLCPTCTIDPSFIPPIWYDEQDPFLDKSVCEYHVRIYTSELEKTISEYGSKQKLKEAAIEIGMTKILQHFNKPLNNAVRDRIRPTAAVVDEYQNTDTSLLGIAFKVAIPAFNFDQISEDDEDQIEESSFSSSDELVVEVGGLNRKLRQLKFALITYQFYYASTRSVSKDFVIRQESDVLARLNYKSHINRLIKFKKALNDVLYGAGYAKINKLGLLKRRALKLKFLFKTDGDPYQLKELWVWPENSCDEYVKIRVPNGSPLKDASMAPIFHFVSNLESIVNDITARETKPWLDFTLEYFFPKYIVDYGDIASLEETREGLGCLIEANLGLEPGAIVDSLTDEIMSAFASIADEYGKEACRSIKQVSTDSPTGKKLQEEEKKSAAELRKEQMTNRYRNEYINKFKSYVVSKIEDHRLKLYNTIIETSVDSHVQDLEDPPIPVDKNGDLFKQHKEEFGLDYVEFDDPPFTKQITSGESTTLRSMEEVEAAAISWASLKFSIKEDGSFKDQIGNSPHFAEAMAAKEEIYKKFEETYVDGAKEIIAGVRDLELNDFISSIGACGVSKMAGQALKCLVGGVTIQQFTSIIIDKFFELVSVNTFSLFFNGLPQNFRQDLSKAFQEQFGGDIDLADLFGVVLEMQGSATMAEVSTTKQKAKAIVKLYEKYYDPLRQSNIQELETLKYLGTESTLEQSNYYIQGRRPDFYDFSKKQYKEGDVYYAIDQLKKPKEAEDYFTYVVKERIKKVKKESNDWKSAVNRFSSMFKKEGVNQTPPPPESPEVPQTEVPETPQPEAQDVIEQTVDEATQSANTSVLQAEINSIQTQLDELDAIYNQATATRSYLQRTLQSLPANDPRRQNLEQQLQNVLRVIEENSQTSLAMTERLNNLQGQLDSSAVSASPVPTPTPSGSSSTTTQSPFASFIDKQTTTANEILNDPAKLSEYEQAAKKFKTTALGAKVDVIFDVVLDFIVEEIKDWFAIDELMNMLQKYPMADFIINSVRDFFTKSCPIEPLFFPPVKDFMKSLTLDVCDLSSSSLTIPKMIFPSIDWKFYVEGEFRELFREAIIKVVSDLIIKLINKILGLLESSLCNAIEAAGGMVAGAIGDGSLSSLGSNLLDALNEAFCNDGDDPETARKRAEELVDALFAPVDFQDGQDYSGSGSKIANVISSVATVEEILEAMVNPGDDSNDQFTKRISNAIRILIPEASFMLGDQTAVEVFFKNLGSYLSVEEKNRIRDLLAAGIPNLPISSAICLTNDQLDEWNRLRQSLLSGPSFGYLPGDLGSDGSYGPGYEDFRSPQDIVNDLNRKTRDALKGIVDDIGSLASDDGPFFGAVTNEAMKDVCNPNNLLNDVSDSEYGKQYEDALVDGFYDNISRTLMWGFTWKGGLLSEALRDKEGKTEFVRKWYKLFNPNYGNATDEQVLKYESKGRWGKFAMDLMGDDDDGDGTPDVQGPYPPTVAIKQRKEILESPEGLTYLTSNEQNVSSYTYTDSVDDDSEYRMNVRSDGAVSKDEFNYRLNVSEEIYEDRLFRADNIEEEIIIDTIIKNPITEAEKEYIEQFTEMSSIQNAGNIRRAFFNKLIQKRTGLTQVMRPAYDLIFAKFDRGVVAGLLSDFREADLIPNGYKFGYVSETLTKDDFAYYNPGTTTKYNLRESDKTLGQFASSRVIALDPALYGGRYRNPPFYIEPRQFHGWLEVATKAFESTDGCDPKKPPLFDFSDIKDRTKMLNRTLRSDPRLTEDPFCVTVQPFNMIFNSKTKSGIDGVVRTTLRTYLVEYMMKGYGLFSSLQINERNYDQALGTYIAQKMKKEMSELGALTSNKKIRIVRERYWYTFLEQCVEAYERMVELGEVVPPDSINDARNRIQMGMDRYKKVTRASKKNMRKALPSEGVRKPEATFDGLSVMKQYSSEEIALQAVAFRLTTSEDRPNFFDGSLFVDIKKNDIRFASVKKLEFFQKIYFIALFEREATLIMSELIKAEFARAAAIFVDGVKDKPYYMDLSRGMFAMKTLFPNTNSRVGLNEFYLEKQMGINNPGTVSDVPSDNTLTPGGLSSEVRFVLERYIRLIDKPQSQRGSLSLSTRSTNLRGVVSIPSFQQFIDDNLDELDGKKLSDYFGNLEFSYSQTMEKIFSNGFVSANNISKLKLLNPGREDEITRAIVYYSFKSQPTDEKDKDILQREVITDSSFVVAGDEIIPSGTLGSTGVKFGLRISVILPEDYFTESQRSQMLADNTLVQRSLLENSLIMDDGGFMFTLISSEVDAIDSEFEDFNPTSGDNSFDLECLINKMVGTTEFSVLFDKCLGLKRISSMVGIYCMETLPAAIGRDETERNEVDEDPDVEDWDRTVNKFTKNYLRREFKSHYLSSDMDGDTDDNDDDNSFTNLIKFSNPFDFDLNFKLPWWKRRRQRFKIYDANSMECADPKKDLQ